jgi:protein SCO1/2
LSKAIHQMPSLKLAPDYLIITFPINPKETPSLALKKRKAYIEGLGQAVPPEAWRFLTGSDQSIGELTQALGYRYKKDGEEYAHPAAIALLTPQGEIARYLYGIEYPPKDLKLALLEASEGEAAQGSIADRVLMFYYHYDPAGRTYALNALNLVEAGGLATLLTLGVFLGYLWKKEKGFMKAQGTERDSGQEGGSGKNAPLAPPYASFGCRP